MRIALAVLLLTQVAAQTGTGSIAGQVRDRDGGVLPGVTVTLGAPNTTPARTAVTNASGQFLLTDVPAGAYDLTVSLVGFKPSSGRILIRPSERVSANPQLSIGDLTESLSVRAPARPAAPTAQAAPPVTGGIPTPVRVGGDIRTPRQLTRVEPAYPQEAVAAGIEGTVVIEAIIGRNGAVRDARIARSVPLLDDAALAAVRQWAYSPTQLNGVPVDVAMTVNISFALAR